MARILLAEDDYSVRSFVARALELDGHEVTPTEDGGLAMESLQSAEGAYDLVLSDIKMPVMDGIALALWVQQNFPAVTVVLMTGYADQRERAHGLDALVADVIDKPFELAELRKRIGRALQGFRAPISSEA
jgi:DNA-binding response OmpR family regulator